MPDFIFLKNLNQFSPSLSLTFVSHQLLLHDIGEPLDALVVLWVVEKDEEGEPLLGQLLRVFERDLTHQRGALVRRPNTDLVETKETERKREACVGVGVFCFAN